MNIEGNGRIKESGVKCFCQALSVFNDSRDRLRIETNVSSNHGQQISRIRVTESQNLSRGRGT